MAALSAEVQTFIVQRLAMFATPSDVAAAVKHEFGIEVSRQAVQFYDPERGQKPAQKWVDLFTAARRAFLDEAIKLPAMHRAYRVAELEDMARKAKARGNYALAAQLLKQIAEEMGDAYTNTRKLQHAGEVRFSGVLAVPQQEDPATWQARTAPQQAALAASATVAALSAEQPARKVA